MKKNILHNGIEISSVGLGVFKSNDGSETENAVSWALEYGYAHIDTAMIYKNEKSVGEGIKKSKVRREDIFLTTKLWNDDIRQGNNEKAFEESLAKLDVDYLDLYLIHWPVEGRIEAWKVLEKLYEEKRVKAIGVSNFQIHHLEELLKDAKIKPMVNQIESHPYFCNQELIDYCQANDIAVQVWSPLGGEGAPLLQDELLNDLAKKYNKTTAQIIIRWNIQRNVIVLPKSVNKDRIESNHHVFDFELSEDDMKSISMLNKNKRVGPDPDTFDF